MRAGLGVLCALVVALAGQARAHEIRPASLQVQQLDHERFALQWRVPARGGAPLPLAVRLPDGCREEERGLGRALEGAHVSRWSVRCAGGLAGREIAIAGLESTLTDVLARVEWRSGASQVVRLIPTQPGFVVEREPTRLAVAATYLVLGIEHILTGIDHLLFVLALLMLVSAWRPLLATITAFTVSHSLTLVAATLGWVHVSPRPVEAVIALSIVFVASEVLHALAGRPGLTARRPWVVALAFGLLHGFGFAGALREAGLPPHALPLALLSFNLGVECGQLVVVTAAIALAHVARPWWEPQRALALRAAAYGIGSLAAFWTLERVVMIGS